MDRLSTAAQRDPDVELDDAAQSIIDDYLDMGDLYPPNGGRECVSIGDFLNATLDDDDIINALSAIASGDSEKLDNLKHRIWNVYAADGYLVRWLREKHPALVARRIEELREEAAERFEVAA